MNKAKTANRYSAEVRSREVRRVLEHWAGQAPQWAAISSLAARIGCTGETLRGWVRQAERDQGRRPGPTNGDQARVKALERENREFRRPTRSCARRQRILRWRSSTAGPSH